ncbi:MAG: LPS export ABC transporter permease LptG [Gammaproteobacteria bacterium]|nr:LPS export ABC transporter permease LptG [Gammaproteobacteria bacterium]
MKVTILDRYIGKQVLLSVVFTLLVLVGLRTLFSLLDEAGKMGEGSYQFADALYYVLLLIPGRVYEFFPMAMLIGGLSALGNMSAQNELTVMRAAGVKTIRIVGSALKVTIILMVFVFACGEWVAPVSSQSALQHRAEALSENTIKRSNRGTWARSGDDFLHIQSIVNDTRLQNVSLFRFDDNAKLVSFISANQAEYKAGSWVFQNGIEQTPDDEKLKQSSFDEMVWQGDLQPKHIAVLQVEPESLNLSGLDEYREYLEKNQLDSRRYQLEYWRKLAQPVSLVVMIILASSFIFGPMRSVSMGARLMTGIVVGFGFHIFNNFFGPISLVYHFPPTMGAFIPVFIFGSLAFYLLHRAK